MKLCFKLNFYESIANHINLVSITKKVRAVLANIYQYYQGNK